MKEKELERLTELKKIEKDIYDQGKEYICGIDEAGRGPLARTCCCCKCNNAKRFNDRGSK